MKRMVNITAMSHERIKLLCIPYAGSSACYYNKWTAYFSNNITVHPVELAGRGIRSDEGFYKSFDDAIEDLLDKVLKIIGESEYVLFGHSMGALIAYELCNRLIMSEVKKPKHLIVSGYAAPQLPQTDLNKDFEEIAAELGGIPDEVWNDQYLYNIFMPILKSDFQILKEYNYPKNRKPISTDITVLYGEDDTKTPFRKVVKWRELTSGTFNCYSFKGGHFFINQHMEEVINCIKNIINNK